MTSAVAYLNFFPRKCPVAVELNLTRKLINVVEQTHNVSAWSDRGKRLPSTSCLLGIRKPNGHCSKVVSGFWRKNTGKTRVTDTHEKNPSYGHTGMQGMVLWALRALSNSNWTEWSTIQGVIERVISKSNQREARGRFEITSAITPLIILLP